MNTREHTLAQQFIQSLTSAGRNAERSSAPMGGDDEEEERRGEASADGSLEESGN